MENTDYVVDANTNLPPAPSKFSHALKYAGIGGLIVIVFGLLMNMLGVSDPGERGGGTIPWITNIIIITATIILAIKNYPAGRVGAPYSFGEAFGVGAITGVLLAVIIGIFTYVYFAFIDPSMLEQVQQAAAASMEDQDLTAEQREQAEGMLGMFTGAGFMGLSRAFINVIFTLLVSLAGAAIFKKDTVA